VTHMILGRAAPVHFAMVALAGWGVPKDGDVWDEESYDFLPEPQAVDLLLEGRKHLIMICGCDLGFKLSAWHGFLLEDIENPEGHEGWGYGHPYSAAATHNIIRQALTRSDRSVLEINAEQQWPSYVESLSASELERITRP
jgi:hypothetical protein